MGNGPISRVDLYGLQVAGAMDPFATEQLKELYDDMHEGGHEQRAKEDAELFRAGNQCIRGVVTDGLTAPFKPETTAGKAALEWFKKILDWILDRSTKMDN